MRRLWIKKPVEKNGHSFWESEVSDDENCLREDDFKNAVCFVPESQLRLANEKIAIMKEALEKYAGKTITIQNVGVTRGQIKVHDVVTVYIDQEETWLVGNDADAALKKCEEMEKKS